VAPFRGPWRGKASLRSFICAFGANNTNPALGDDGNVKVVGEIVVDKIINLDEIVVGVYHFVVGVDVFVFVNVNFTCYHLE